MVPVEHCSLTPRRERFVMRARNPTDQEPDGLLRIDESQAQSPRGATRRTQSPTATVQLAVIADSGFHGASTRDQLCASEAASPWAIDNSAQNATIGARWRRL